MTIPKIVSKNKREYIFVKEYPTYIRYQDTITGCMVCFTKHELSLITETVKPNVYLSRIGIRKYEKKFEYSTLK